ncbi:MAG: GNAT family N-acetyltransferase [Anaerolineaceae bacterium]|nr:GNAT family N-acetyltransferase [Anaerolineaceae bacterium]
MPARNLEGLNIGVIGACGRGASFKAACDALELVRIHAVCDINEDGLAGAAELLGAAESYTDYQAMLQKSDLDAVIIGTPMQLHVPQAVAALDEGLHVLSEVPAGVSVEQCRTLVAACKRSRGVYMMGENYTYMRSNAMVREIVRRGLFGTPYYAEGEYLHELKHMNELTPWRRKWQTGINGVTYGTHSLGPILQWMPGDRVVKVACAGSGRHHRDPRGEQYENEASCVMLCRMQSGGLVKIRLDMLSDRPHAMTNYELQGTDGCYESARAPGQCDRIWLRAKCGDDGRWLDLKTLEDEFLPDFWKEADESARGAGHGGGDYFEMLDFIDASLGKRPVTVGIHQAMDMTLPGLVSQRSIAEGGRWLEVPDSRSWTGEEVPGPQLQMVWPKRLLGAPPEVKIPEGYILRQYEPADAEAHEILMHKAGFTTWNRKQLAAAMRNVLPGGFFLVEHRATGCLVATAMAWHNPSDLHPFGGELSWVAGDPQHKGRRLGLAVCAAATRRLLECGYREVYLETDDFRLPAIKTYLLLGYEPLMFRDGMAERWAKVRRQLDGIQDYQQHGRN